MEIRRPEQDMSFIDFQFATEPCPNIIDKEKFNKRTQEVFKILYTKLKKSFGPGGAGTFISAGGNYYNTKDGFNIMKNITFDKHLDIIISDMVMRNCSRLNFTVGDGTTTAVIATESIYDEYMNNKEKYEDNFILPRDIIKSLDYWKNIILEKIDKVAIQIRDDDTDTLEENIRKVVEISSNGDPIITEMITSLYRQLKYPAITSVISKDGIMRASVVNGYKIEVALTDKIYINNDNETMNLNGANIIIFDHKVTYETYKNILLPLNKESYNRGMNLICIAPFYDEKALNGVIKSDLIQEYQRNHSVNLVLMVCGNKSSDKVLLNDLAMLLNTTLISTITESDIIEKINSTDKKGIYYYFDLDNRNIPGIGVAVKTGESTISLKTYSDELKNENFYKGLFGEEWSNDTIRLGYCSEMDLGLKGSIFSGFFYDENMYNKYLQNAKSEYDEIRKKCERIGTFSFELIEKQKRLYSLGLKTGLIEVGADDDLSQNYIKDVVDDAIKAAASAYNNGVILGCNVTLIKIIYNILHDKDRKLSSIDKLLLNNLYEGFRNVYKSVMDNVFSDVIGIDYSCRKNMINDIRRKTPYKKFNLLKNHRNITVSKGTPLFDYIIKYSIKNNVVLDVTTGKFSKDIINSAETDKEILKATISLLSLLITGNQLVLI